MPRNTIETRFFHPIQSETYRQYHPIKYQPMPTIPDISRPKSIDHSLNSHNSPLYSNIPNNGNLNQTQPNHSSHLFLKVNTYSQSLPYSIVSNPYTISFSGQSKFQHVSTINQKELLISILHPHTRVFSRFPLMP